MHPLIDPNSLMKVHINYCLPIEKTYWACDLDSKQEVHIFNNEYTHAILFEGALYVSPELHNKLYPESR